MATMHAMNGTKLLVKLGDAATPEIFTHPCMINTARGITFSSTTSDETVPTCDEPELPAWIARAKDGLSASITGAGTYTTDGIADFWAWFTQEESRNIQVLVDVDAADGGGYWAMAAHLTEFSVSGERKAKATFDCTILSDGIVLWVDAT